MIIQTPELFAHKDAAARANIGRHFLIGLWCKEGFILARRGSNRESSSKKVAKPPGWISEFDARIVVGAIGDLGSMREVLSDIRDAQDALDEIVGARYITIKATESAARQIFRWQYEQSALPHGAHVLMASVDRPNEFSFIDFRGKLKRYSDFAIVGGVVDTDGCKAARMGAIAYLTRRCANGKNRRWKLDGTAIRVVQSVFARFDKPGSNPIVEFLLIRKTGTVRYIRR